MSTLAAQCASESDSVDHLDPNELRDLMRVVTVTTQRLEHTHTALHAQVSRLQQELAEANAALRRSQALAALGEMAAGIAHEVRNPLGSIQLYVQMLAEDVADRPEQAELCGKIARAVTGLDAIVRDVLSFARDTVVRAENVSIPELFDRSVAACESLLRDGNVQVHRTGAAGHIVADSVLIAQALGNVVRNAIEAMIESPNATRELRLASSIRRVRCPGGETARRVVISVQDTGPGIADDVLDRVFNPFFTTRATGTGLGLAIVHRIVDAHGGHVHIHNGTAGGACVELCLPERPPDAYAVSNRESKIQISKSRNGVSS
jgi:signal transduction histidine kinase